MGLQCSTNDQATEARSKTRTVRGSGSACVPRKEGCLRTGQSAEERLEGERVGGRGGGGGLNTCSRSCVRPTLESDNRSCHTFVCAKMAVKICVRSC